MTLKQFGDLPVNKNDLFCVSNTFKNIYENRCLFQNFPFRKDNFPFPFGFHECTFFFGKEFSVLGFFFQIQFTGKPVIRIKFTELSVNEFFYETDILVWFRVDRYFLLSVFVLKNDFRCILINRACSKFGFEF